MTGKASGKGKCGGDPTKRRVRASPFGQATEIHLNHNKQTDRTTRNPYGASGHVFRPRPRIVMYLFLEGKERRPDSDADDAQSPNPPIPTSKKLHSFCGALPPPIPFAVAHRSKAQSNVLPIDGWDRPYALSSPHLSFTICSLAAEDNSFPSISGLAVACAGT